MPKWVTTLKNFFTGLFSISDPYRLKIYEQKISCYNRLLLAARKHYMAQMLRFGIKATKGNEWQQAFLDLGDAYLDSLIYASEGVAEAYKEFMRFDENTISQETGGTDFRLAYFSLANAMRDDLSVEKFHDLTTLLSNFPAPLGGGRSPRRAPQATGAQ